MEAGIKVRVLEEKNLGDHSFEGGTIVVSRGIKHSAPFEDWDQFEDEDTGYTQYMKPEHYEIVEEKKASTSGEVKGKSADLSKAKTIYAVYDGAELIYLTPDREDARGLKADLGGKRDGIIILAYGQAKEIR